MDRHLLIDMGGPLMEDWEVEELRKNSVLDAARYSGILDVIEGNLGYAANKGDFLDNYERGKFMLKELAEGAEPYSDLNRLAATLVLCSDPKKSYKDALNGTQEMEEEFWKIFSPQIKEAAVRGMKPESFTDLYYLKEEGDVHIVTDNHRHIFENVFLPLLEANFHFYGLGKLEYRKPDSSSPPEQCVYISDYWGNKRDPETWSNIFRDLGVGEGHDVWFVDDSEKKLDGLRRCETDADKHLVLYGNGSTQEDVLEIPSLSRLFLWI